MRPNGGGDSNSNSKQTRLTSTPSIANDINIATRALHTSLNGLIISRLPLSLPPYSSHVGFYTIGLQAFAGIYVAFEAAWDECMSRYEKAHEEEEEEEEEEGGLHAALARLLPPELRRTNALKHDLAYLHNRLDRLTPSETHGNHGNNEHKPNVINETQPSTDLSSVTAHIHHTITAKPHLIIAYTWVMYMALFSGGRYIRAYLRAAGPDFWGRAGDEYHHNNQEQDGELGYSFLNSLGEHDGEDIKAAFKQRLAQVEVLLTPQQRLEVVSEAGEVFKRCLTLVGELDLMTRLASAIRSDAGNTTTHLPEPASKSGLLAQKSRAVAQPVLTSKSSLVVGLKSDNIQTPPACIRKSHARFFFDNYIFLAMILIVTVLLWMQSGAGAPRLLADW